jgi:hypothetical protein
MNTQLNELHLFARTRRNPLWNKVILTNTMTYARNAQIVRLAMLIFHVKILT